MTVQNAILKAADKLFSRDGFAATGVAALADEAGVTKRTLYKHFGSKDGLFLAWLCKRDSQSRALALEAADHMGDTPRARILALFDNLKHLAALKQFYGCPFSRAILEFSGATDHDAFQAASAHKKEIADWFLARATALGVDNPHTVVEGLCVLYEGALMRIAATGSPEPATAARRMAEALLD